MPQDKGFYLREVHPKMQGIRCELCVHFSSCVSCGEHQSCLRLRIDNERLITDGTGGPRLLVPPDFRCGFFERRPVIDKHCNTCKHWQRTDTALTVTWSGCSARSHEHEVLMTRESHYCDKWGERP